LIPGFAIFIAAWFASAHPKASGTEKKNSRTKDNRDLFLNPSNVLAALITELGLGWRNNKKHAFVSLFDLSISRRVFTHSRADHCLSAEMYEEN
jgi:hypothetical protein